MAGKAQVLTMQADNGTDGLERVTTEVNRQLASRGAIGNLEATELCLPLCMLEAARVLEADYATGTTSDGEAIHAFAWDGASATYLLDQYGA